MRAAAVMAFVLVSACGRSAAPVADSDATAIAAAERKAVADTDAARRDAVVRAAPGEQNPE
jgi:hypothetical protein